MTRFRNSNCDDGGLRKARSARYEWYIVLKMVKRSRGRELIARREGTGNGRVNAKEYTTTLYVSRWYCNTDSARRIGGYPTFDFGCLGLQPPQVSFALDIALASRILIRSHMVTYSSNHLTPGCAPLITLFNLHPTTSAQGMDGYPCSYDLEASAEGLKLEDEWDYAEKGCSRSKAEAIDTLWGELLCANNESLLATAHASTLYLKDIPFLPYLKPIPVPTSSISQIHPFCEDSV
ncbi:hypothetical protein BDQ17DRAFT_1440025 [Cyathus striatus]|nr:hypothetical protein BDQ17DRAFT_1440025 [Cyathus striatus]